ncbi:MAG: YicC family protein [Methylophilaceae bacterium]|nr:YicC family protein [Methylophilaceae bacterium]
MIYSMTGFATVQCTYGFGTLMVELRAVNHRYLELQLRLDEALRAFEPQLREMVTARIGRGKVEFRASLQAAPNHPVPMELDQAMLMQLATLNHAVLAHFPQSRPLSVADVLRWPGVLMTKNSAVLEDLRENVLTAVEQCLDEFTTSREREGAKLAATILERVSRMEALVEKIRPMLPDLLKTYQEKLAARLHEVLQTADDTRIHQELALYAQKIDVDEELERLSTHLQEVRRVLNRGGAVGKRLDFLMQELHREANTLGAKSVSGEISQLSMELKVLIEQIREQVQNIE